jgi:SAM-dependent methyltransferase
MMDFLICPDCRFDFKTSDSQLLCERCDRKYCIVDGIPVLKKNSDYFYDYEFSREEYQKMIQRAEQGDWFQAFAESRNQQGKSISDYNIYYNSDERKALWKYLLPVSRDSRVLDYGSGFGNISSSLSRSFHEVISMEPTFARLRMWQIRAKQNGIRNAYLVCYGGDSPNLPFRDEYFDLIVLNGVMEWLPVSLEQGHPRQVQLRALQEIRRVLKKGGTLYIGIENRFALRYFLGHPDHHAGLRFATLLPRRLASLYSKIVKGKDYRVYTYSWWGYKKLLKQAGFANVNIYWPYPTYATPIYITDASDKKTIEYLVDQYSGNALLSFITRYLVKMNVLKYIFDTYGIVGR